MQNKRGLLGILLVVLAGALLVAAGALVYLGKMGPSGQQSVSVDRSTVELPALSKGDSVSDLESDVNSTNFDDVDRDLKDADSSLKSE